MPHRVSVANFGAASGGLATVGYKILHPDLTTQAARTTSGVSEVSSGSGIYTATVSYPNNFEGIILWDTGGGSPKYAAESINPLDPGKMADEVRTMLRSLNTSLSAHLEKLLGKKSQKDLKIDTLPVETIILGFRNDISALEKRLYQCVDGMEFSPQITVTSDTSKIEASIRAVLESQASQTDAIKSVLRAMQGGMEGRVKAASLDMKRTLDMVEKNMDRIGADNGSKLQASVAAMKSTLESTTAAMIEDVKKVFDELAERSKQKTKNEELLALILEAVNGARVDGAAKKAIPDYLNPLMLSFAGRK